MKKPFLILTSWAGYSAKPGSREMTINDDGTYMVKEEFSRPDQKADNFEKSGKLSKERLAEIKDFANKNFMLPSYHMITDVGWKITHIVDDKVIKIENDSDSWKKIRELIPEYSNTTY